MKNLLCFLLICLMGMSVIGCSFNQKQTIVQSNINEVNLSSTLQDCPTTDADVLKEGNCGVDVKWILYEDGLLCIFGKGDMYYISDSDEIEWHTERQNIKNVYIADGITNISHFSFKECTNLETLRLPNTIKEIQLSAFESCSKLKELTLPSRLEKIEYWAFAYCDSLTQITIPGTIKHLDNYTFQGCSNLKSITISEGVETIGFDVFEDSVNLESVAIPKSLRKIDVYTFRNCPKLNAVYYAGSKQEWNNIIISKKGNKHLINSNVHFNTNESSLLGDSNEKSTIGESDFLYYDSSSNKDTFEFGFYYGFQNNNLTSFRLDDSTNKKSVQDNYVLPRNMSVDMSIEEYITAYDINSTNSVIQVWKGLSYFYRFEKTSISSLTKDAEWADIVIGWFQTSDDKWHRLSAKQAMSLMQNKLNIDCKAVYSISIDCKNPNVRNSVIYTYSTLEDWAAFNR